MKLARGASRDVLLTGRWALKFPSLRSWKGFVMGLLANMQEREWSGYHKRLLPLSFSLPGGWLNVMPQVETRDEPLSKEEFRRLFKRARLPVENKADSLGVFYGEIVAIDYGDFGRWA